jgi:hypothetical protein
MKARKLMILIVVGMNLATIVFVDAPLKRIRLSPAFPRAALKATISFP